MWTIAIFVKYIFASKVAFHNDEIFNFVRSKKLKYLTNFFCSAEIKGKLLDEYQRKDGGPKLRYKK